MQEKWYAIGGIYYDGTWSKMEPGTGECFDPFDTKEEAEAAQLAGIWKKIDICFHHLFVVKLDVELNIYRKLISSTETV